MFTRCNNNSELYAGTDDDDAHLTDWQLCVHFRLTFKMCQKCGISSHVGHDEI